MLTFLRIFSLTPFSKKNGVFILSYKLLACSFLNVILLTMIFNDVLFHSVNTKYSNFAKVVNYVNNIAYGSLGNTSLIHILYNSKKLCKILNMTSGLEKCFSMNRSSKAFKEKCRRISIFFWVYSFSTLAVFFVHAVEHYGMSWALAYTVLTRLYLNFFAYLVVFYFIELIMNLRLIIFMLKEDLVLDGRREPEKWIFWRSCYFLICEINENINEGFGFSIILHVSNNILSMMLLPIYIESSGLSIFTCHYVLFYVSKFLMTVWICSTTTYEVSKALVVSRACPVSARILVSRHTKSRHDLGLGR